MATSATRPAKEPDRRGAPRAKSPASAKGAKGTSRGKKKAAVDGKAAKRKAPATRKAPAKRKAAKGRAAKGAARGRASAHRYAVVHDDVDRPHMRLGLIWFVALVLALFLGPVPLGVLCGLVAGVGGLQVAKAWRRRRQPAFVPVAGAAALLLPIAAAWGGRALGAAILVAVAASFGGALLRPSRQPIVAAAGWTIRSWLFVGGSSATIVLLAGYDSGAAIALVVLMCAYDAGDYVVGSGARTVWEGPLGGIAAVAVLTLSLYVLNLSPFHGAAVVAYGAVFAALAPLGQLAASAVLPDASAIASGLRRFDSILLAGPVWAGLLAAEVGL